MPAHTPSHASVIDRYFDRERRLVLFCCAVVATLLTVGVTFLGTAVLAVTTQSLDVVAIGCIAVTAFVTAFTLLAGLAYDRAPY